MADEDNNVFELFHNRMCEPIKAVKVTPATAHRIAGSLGLLVVTEINPMTGEETPGINVPTSNGTARASSVHEPYIALVDAELEVLDGHWFERDHHRV